MKKFINILFGILAIAFVQSCSEELAVDDVINGVTSGAVLRNLGETNNLDIEVPGSTYSIILEAQDAQGGTLLSEVRVNVGFNPDNKPLDSVDVTPFSVIPAASFNETSPTTNNLPVATFSTTLSDMLTQQGLAITDVSAGQAFVVSFDMILTDGRIFNVKNATANVTRTGRFSYFNAQFRYAPTIGDPQRLVLNDLRVADDNGLGILASGGVDTVFLEFDRDDAFVVAPTITELSSVNSNTVLTNTLQQMTGNDANIYFFLYTAGADAADTVSFRVSDGEATAGLVMTADTLKAAYIVDNVAPAAMVGDRSIALNDTSAISSVSIELLFAEPLGQDTVAFTITSNNVTDFDDLVVTQVIEEGAESVTLTFVPMLGMSLIPDAGLDFDIITDMGVAPEDGAGIADLIGNQVTRTYSVEIFD